MYSATEFTKLRSFLHVLRRNFHITEYCSDGKFTCQYNSGYDMNTDCMNTTLQCMDSDCTALLNRLPRLCFFDTSIGVNLTSQPIRCCFCNDSNITPPLWWDCGGDTTTFASPSNGEQ